MVVGTAAFCVWLWCCVCAFGRCMKWWSDPPLLCTHGSSNSLYNPIRVWWVSSVLGEDGCWCRLERLEWLAQLMRLESKDVRWPRLRWQVLLQGICLQQQACRWCCSFKCQHLPGCQVMWPFWRPVHRQWWLDWQRCGCRRSFDWCCGIRWRPQSSASYSCSTFDQWLGNGTICATQVPCCHSWLRLWCWLIPWWPQRWGCLHWLQRFGNFLVCKCRQLVEELGRCRVKLGHVVVDIQLQNGCIGGLDVCNKISEGDCIESFCEVIEGGVV